MTKYKEFNYYTLIRGINEEQLEITKKVISKCSDNIDMYKMNSSSYLFIYSHALREKELVASMLNRYVVSKSKDVKFTHGPLENMLEQRPL